MKKRELLINKRVFESLTIQIILIVLFVLFISLDLEGTEKNIRIVSFLGSIIFLILLILWRYIVGFWLSPFFLFFCAFFFFQFGQCFLFIFDLDIYMKVFHEHSHKLIYSGSLITILAMQLFYFGATFIYFFQTKNTSKSTQTNYFSTILAMRKVGWFLILFTAPIKLYFLLTKTIISLKYGYMNLYNYEGSNQTFQEPKIYVLLSPLFLAGIIMLIISYKEQKKIVKLLMLVLILISFFDFLSGERGLFIATVLTIFCMWNFLVSKFNYKSTLYLFMLFFIVINLIPFMAHLRLQEEKSVKGIFEAMEYVKTENPFIATINELGGSMSPLLYTMKVIPESFDYKMGESYLASLLTIIPNVFGFMGETHPASSKTHLSSWLMEVHNLTHGPGYSLIAESYYNFGFFGIGSLMIWGGIMAGILKIKFDDIKFRNPLGIFMVFISLLLFFTFPRGQSVDFVRYFVYYVLGCMLLVRLIEKNKSFEGYRYIKKKRS